MPSSDVHLTRLIEQENLKDQALAAIRSAIVFAELVPNALYSVQMLAEQLGISRTPVREALLELEAQGLVEAVRNRGFRVVRPTASEIAGLFEVRLLLEIPGHTEAIRSATHGDLRGVRESLAALLKAADHGDAQSFLIRDREFHLRILQLGPNPWFARIVSRLRDQATLRRPSEVKNFLSTANEEHVAILAALESGDVEAMSALVRQHLLDTKLRWIGS